MYLGIGSAMRRRYVCVAGAFCTALLAGFAATGAERAKPAAGNCMPAVTSGFSGDLNASYSGDYGGGGDSGAGGDGGSGAGAGAGEGKVLGGLMTIERLADAVKLGSAVTDSVNGLVTVKPCLGDLPVLITLTGQTGAKYYDEGTNQLTDFGPGKVLHALIDAFDENVGVSPLTEAAYRYALNNYILNPQEIRAGRVALASNGTVTGLTLAQVKAANSAVLAEINRAQTTSMRLTTVRSLPTPIDGGSASSSLPSNRYGVSAAVLGGLATMAKAYQASIQNPGLAAGEQLARDLTDGKLDGFALDGSPAAGQGAPITYDPVRFPIALGVGANAVSAKFGSTTTLANATAVAELTNMDALNGVSRCNAGGDSAALIKDGSVTVVRTDCSGTSTTLRNFAAKVRLISGSGAGELPRTFFVKEDGTVWGWGEAACGMLGTGETAAAFHPAPVQLPGIKDITSIAVGSYFALARDNTGAVYSWGLNYLGELGMGTTPPGSATCQNDFTVPDFRFEAAVSTPAKISGLSNVVTVAADRVTAYALDGTGSLFQWGLIPTGYNFSAPQPYYGEYGTQPVPLKVAGLPKTVAIAVSYYMKMALVADGTLWGFGPNIIGNFGDGTLAVHITPTPVPGLSRVAEIAASGNSPFVALLQDGTIRYWGGCCTGANQSIPAYILKVPTAPVPGNTPFYSASGGSFVGTLPQIRHVTGNGGKVLLYGADGSLFQFPKSDVEQVFVAVDSTAFAPSGGGVAANYEGLWWKSPASSEAGWGINLAHQGDTIFASWFTYDLTGKGWWLVMTAAKTTATTFSGALLQGTGPAFDAVPFPPLGSPGGATGSTVGTGTLTFSDANNGTFSYTVNGISQTKAITRQSFGPIPVCTFGAQANLALATNYQDLWWKPGGAEAGWGINLTHQGDTIFGTWYTYDRDHSAMWLVVTAVKTGPRTYTGSLLRTTGPPFNAVPFPAIGSPGGAVGSAVGTATFDFTDGNSATFTYTVNGVTQSKPITREVFTAPGTVCQ
jgi:hypothetical protein